MTISTNGVQVESLMKWGKPKEVVTKLGPRLLRKANPTDEFWAAWRSNRQALKAAGISVTQKLNSPMEYEVCWWQMIPKEELEQRQKSLEASRAMDADIAIPVPDGCELRGYQRAGVAYAVSKMPKYGVIIADEMGTGKTIQSACVINALPEINRVLVITKRRLKMNWFRELKKWLVRDLSIGFADSDCFPTTDIVIIHFHILHKHAKRLENYWDLLIVDEAHLIKNPKARWTKCVLGYKPTRKESAEGMLPKSGLPAKRKLMLTGTPIENRPADFYPLLHYCAPDKFPSRSAYEKRYCGARSGFFGWQTNGATRLDELQQITREVCMIRRLKRDVLPELPAKTRMIVELEPEGLEKVITNESQVVEKYEDAQAHAQASLEIIKAIEDDGEYHAKAKEIRKIFFVPFEEIAKVRHETAVAKVPLVVEAIKEDLEEVSKILVAFHHKDVGEMLAAQFPGVSLKIDGMTSPEDSDRFVQAFQNDPKVQILFGSLLAVGEGLNLTAAKVVGFVEEDWRPGKISQFEDRAHRYGQKDNVFVKHWVLKGSYDARMVTVNVRKQEIIDRALDIEKGELMAEPSLSVTHEQIATRKQIKIEASVMSSEQIDAVKRHLSLLASIPSVEIVDSKIVQALVAKQRIAAAEAVIGRKLLLRYAENIEADLSQCGGWKSTHPTEVG